MPTFDDKETCYAIIKCEDHEAYFATLSPKNLKEHFESPGLPIRPTQRYISVGLTQAEFDFASKDTNGDFVHSFVRFNENEYIWERHPQDLQDVIRTLYSVYGYNGLAAQLMGESAEAWLATDFSLEEIAEWAQIGLDDPEFAEKLDDVGVTARAIAGLKHRHKSGQTYVEAATTGECNAASIVRAIVSEAGGRIPVDALIPDDS